MIKEINFLVLGNDNTLTSLDVDKAANSGLIVIGINRSYVFYPKANFLFVQDPEIVIEMFRLQYSDDMISDLNIRTTPYFLHRTNLMWERKNKNVRKYDIKEADVKRLYRLTSDRAIRVLRKAGMLRTAKTIPCAIQLLGEKVFKGHKCRFFIFGSGLQHDAVKNHFWSGTHMVLKPSMQTSNPRQLNAQYVEFAALKSRYGKNPNIEIISCSPGSKLNKIFKYEPVDLVLDHYT